MTDAMMEMSLVIPVLLTLGVMYAIVTDVTSFRIPNMVNLALLALYPVTLLLFDTDANWLNGIIAFLILFAVGYLLFAFRVAGGGDVKMLAVLGLWVGWGVELVAFLVLMSLLGGVLTLFLLVGRKLMPYLILKWRGEQATIPRVLTYGEPLPYGVAIGSAFLWLLWRGELPVYG